MFLMLLLPGYLYVVCMLFFSPVAGCCLFLFLLRMLLMQPGHPFEKQEKWHMNKKHTVTYKPLAQGRRHSTNTGIKKNKIVEDMKTTKTGDNFVIIHFIHYTYSDIHIKSVVCSLSHCQKMNEWAGEKKTRQIYTHTHSTTQTVIRFL